MLINALVGCGVAAGFPQFSMTITALSEKSGIAPGVLMTGDTVKSAAIVFAMLLSGFAYNRFGARKVFIFSLLTSALPQFFIPHAGSIFAFMAFKVIQGLSAMIFPVFLVIILRWMEEKNAGLSTAVFNSIFFAGGGLGGTMAGFLIAGHGWLASYYALGAVQLFTGLLWLCTVKEAPPGERAESSEGVGREGVAKEVIASPVLWLLALSFFATMWGVQAITVDWALFGEWLGYDALALSKIMSAVTLGIASSCILSGKTSDFFAKAAAKKSLARVAVLMAGHALTLASVCFLLFADLGNFTLFYAATFLFTFSVSWGLGAFYCILPEIYDARTVPLATGFTGGLADMGMPAAPMVVGVFFGLRGLWGLGWASCAAAAAISFLAGLSLLVILRGRS